MEFDYKPTSPMVADFTNWKKNETWEFLKSYMCFQKALTLQEEKQAIKGITEETPSSEGMYQYRYLNNQDRSFTLKSLEKIYPRPRRMYFPESVHRHDFNVISGFHVNEKKSRYHINEVWEVIAPIRDVKISIGHNIFNIHYELRAFAEQIEEAKEILNYQEDWDDEGAEATDISTFTKAVKFLIMYVTYVRDYLGGCILSVPYIDIMRDGSVYIQWETEKARFLIIFKKSNHPNAYFFGERLENKIPFKSAIENGSSVVDEAIALWMRNNLV